MTADHYSGYLDERIIVQTDKSCQWSDTPAIEVIAKKSDRVLSNRNTSQLEISDYSLLLCHLLQRRSFLYLFNLAEQWTDRPTHQFYIPEGIPTRRQTVRADSK